MVVPNEEIKKILNQVMLIEDDIDASTKQAFIKDVYLKIESGTLLNKLKEIIKKSNKHWEVEAPHLFITSNGEERIGKTTRCERMKVAKIEDAKEFSNFGWCKLALISSCIIFNKIKRIKDFLKLHNIDENEFTNISEREAKERIEYLLLKNKLKLEKIKISNDLVKRAVEVGVKIDKKIIEDLKKGDAEDKIRLLVDYNYRDKDTKKCCSKKHHLGNLESLGLSFYEILKDACNDPDSACINVETLDDVAHYIGKLYAIKSHGYV